MTESRIFKIICTIGLVAVIAIMYQHYVVLPKAEIEAERAEARLEREAAEQAEIRRDLKLNACSEDAYAAYSANWDRQCEFIGRDPDCSLPRYQAEEFDQELDRARTLCVELYQAS